MKHRILEWDSRFFGLTVAQINVDGTTAPASLKGTLEESDADVTYVFVPADIAARFEPILGSFPSANRYDRKVTFEKEAPAQPPIEDDDALEETAVESEPLLELAYASGHLSRFFLDPGFEPHFRAMYGEWLRKSLRDSDTRVFCYVPGGEILAMVTATVRDAVGQIGLIGVDAACRGQGIGVRLLTRCERFYAARRATTYRVVTQKDNAAACRLYEKCGYHIADEQHVWHIWRA